MRAKWRVGLRTKGASKHLPFVFGPSELECSGPGERVTVDEFITKWKRSGGNERANTQMFVTDLCELLELPKPEPAEPDTGVNDYVFERHVIKEEIGGGTSNGWIDLYKRDAFILEAKQGSARDAEAVDRGLGESLRDLFGQTAADRFKRGMAKRGTGQWASAMQRAAGQAEGYAKALPKDHGWPPFLLASDVGYCIDVYANFARDGRSYAPFPDRRKFRIELDDLRDEEVRKRLRAIWLAPMSLDPSAEAARVTREVATHLAALAKDIEARERNADGVAAFLMRLLFTMFAEDTGLIPKESFGALLKKVRDRPENLKPQLSALWQAMDTGGFAGALGESGEMVRRFNGYLFKDRTAIDLTVGEIEVLIEAAEADWRQVEPAIFGTLLERALNPKERAQLGAHYTPRAYVERLVQPTIMEPLREDWLGARTAAMEAAEAGDKEKARRLVEDFHGKLARTKVLDPACGTGNFLYVAMARMKELEGEVLELLEELGDRQYLAEISGHTITPENFLGIEINPRAAAIAQLVLWIGYLQWHFTVNGEDRMPEPPVLRDVKTIECRDALIDYDRKELDRDERGQPLTRWDGETMKLHAVTGKQVPDETARVEVYRYVNPRAAKWPKADFIIGNPPFIGKVGLRAAVGDGYFEALFRTSDLPESADLVTHWWDQAASLVRKKKAVRFGFVTTNSLSQKFGRRVVQKHLAAVDPLYIAYAIPDHPWIDERGSAAVRIAMTVGTRTPGAGRLVTVADERKAPEGISLTDRVGIINADLKIGADVTAAKELRSNQRIAANGCALHGNGFLLTEGEAASFGWPTTPGIAEIIKPYRNGRDLMDHARALMVIDAFGLSEADLQARWPQIYAHLLDHVKPHRDQNARESIRKYWWLFGWPRPELRKALHGLDRYVVTVETTKHRVFQFVDKEIVPDHMLVCIALSGGYELGVLTSRFHLQWTYANSGLLGVASFKQGHRYTKSQCFDSFPFPDTSDEALKQRVCDAAEKLDALRKQVMGQHPDLTLTKLYNTLQSLRAAEASCGTLSEKERDIATRGCVSLIRQYHDEIDAAVAEAYGWVDLVPLMHMGAAASSAGSPAANPLSAALEERVEEIIIERLVALNKERAEEEARGQVRWLRPEFQASGYVAPAEQAKLALPEEVAKTGDIIDWPAKLPEQVVAVANVVERARGPVAANDVARAFKGKRANSIVPVLDALAGMGRLRKLEDGRFAA